MSDDLTPPDLPPPDLTKTADVPLGGLLPFDAQPRQDTGEPQTEPSTDAPTEPAAPGGDAGDAEGTDATATRQVLSAFGSAVTSEPPEPLEPSESLFTNARSVRLTSSEDVVDSPILEHEARPAAGPLPTAEAQAEPLGVLRALWEESHDRGVPFYRRQGPVAGIGLLALLIIGAISFPWTRATIESGVITLIDESKETAAVGSGTANRTEIIEGPSSGTMVLGTKATSAAGSTEALQSTSSQIASTANVTAAGVTSGQPVRTPATGGAPPTIAETTATTEIVAPVQLSCADPAAVPPACTTTEAPTTTEPETPVTEEPATTTTTEAEVPATTVRRTTTTTEPETTTTEGPTTTRPRPTTTTTEPDEEETTTTTEPDEEETTTTTEPDEEETTTTTEPDEEETTTTTEPDDTIPDTTDPPIDDSGGSVPTIVSCTPTTQPGPGTDAAPRTIC
ncbi:MAG: hypothetical protein AAGA65_21385 [Actinomycetota bacterium]